jgi:hypothetical protein
VTIGAEDWQAADCLHPQAHRPVAAASLVAGWRSSLISRMTGDRRIRPRRRAIRERSTGSSIRISVLPLLVKDANTQVQSLSTGFDSGGNLVPMHVAATLIGGIAAPACAGTPLPVISTAGDPAVDGSGTIVAGGGAQPLFGGATPINGYLVANNSAAMLYVCDVSSASAGGASIPISPGTAFATPSGYRAAGPVSIYGSQTGQAFAARRW